MGSELNGKLEKLAYNMNLAYELIDRIEAGEAIKAMIAGLSSGHPSVKPHAEKSAQLQDEFAQKHICTDQGYKNAVSTLEREFGHIEPVQELLKKVYGKCPTLTIKQKSTWFLYPRSIGIM